MDSLQDEYESFLEYLQKGVMLLDLEELNNFHFDVNKEDPEFKELGNLLIKEGVNEDNYKSTIGPKSSMLLKKIFTPNKEEELHSILSEIESKYKDDIEIYRTSLASRLFLNDENGKHYYLPLALSRLMEDVYEAFSKQ